MILGIIAGAAVAGVFWLGWRCGSDTALTLAAKMNYSAMQTLGVDWPRYVEAIQKATVR